jgi:hypothetical protein
VVKATPRPLYPRDKEEVRTILIRTQETAWGPQVYLLIVRFLERLPMLAIIEHSVTEPVNNELERTGQKTILD